MERKIKYSVLGETATSLKQDLEELRNARNQLLVDVNTIGDGYKGKDANIIITKYKEKIVNVDTYLQSMENVQIILNWLSNNYRNSHDKAKKNLAAFSSLIPIDGTENNMSSI